MHVPNFATFAHLLNNFKLCRCFYVLLVKTMQNCTLKGIDFQFYFLLNSLPYNNWLTQNFKYEIVFTYLTNLFD